jgi:hypothetical protein
MRQDTLRNLEVPDPPQVSGIRAIFDLVIVEDIHDLWKMHWAPRREQTLGICGCSAMPSQMSPDTWGSESGLPFVWCEECANIKNRILPLDSY